MRYGVGYQGSKNRIAKDIINILPSGERFVDLFGGGFAMSHCALLSDKYSKVLYNEYDKLCFDLICNAIRGDYNPEKMDYHWISREEFNENKSKNPYIAFCWSFSNNSRDYLFGKHLEPWKKAVWYARVLKDYSLLTDMGIISDGSRTDIKAHEAEYRAKYADWCGANVSQCLTSLQSLESLERLQSLESLKRLKGLQMSNDNYLNYCYKHGDIVYCDPPYESAKKYRNGDFNHNEFYNWVAQAEYPIYFSSYAISDERFTPIWVKDVHKLYGSNTNSKTSTEMLYCNDVALHTYENEKIAV